MLKLTLKRAIERIFIISHDFVIKSERKALARTLVRICVKKLKGVCRVLILTVVNQSLISTTTYGLS